MSPAKMVMRLCLLLCCLLLTERLAFGGRAGHHDKHGHDSHGRGSHEDDSHGHDSHKSDSHGSDSHGSDSHKSDSHGSDSHGSDSHGSDSHEHSSHESDSHGSDSHGSDRHEGYSHKHKHSHHGKVFSDATRAYKSVLSGYNRHVVPQKVKGVPVKVAIEVLMVQLNELDKDAGEMEAVIWMDQAWNDPRLSWSKKHYGIEKLSFGADDIWVPDLAIYNSVKAPEMLLNEIVALVDHSGNVTLVPSMRVRTTCPITDDDSISCTYVIGSWVHDDRFIDVQGTNLYGDWATYYTNTHWTLESITPTRSVKEYACCPGLTYPSIDITFTFKRK